MYKEINTPAPIEVATFGDLTELKSRIDGLRFNKCYMFNITGTVAEAVGLPREYGVITVKKYNTHNACILEFDSYMNNLTKYKLRKFNTVWDSAWTKIEQVAITE